MDKTTKEALEVLNSLKENERIFALDFLRRLAKLRSKSEKLKPNK